MNAKVQVLIDEARRLAPAEPVDLLLALQHLIAPVAPAWEADWAAEGAARVAAWQRGESSAVDADAAMTRLREKHGLS